jgi:hypothetical protein
MEEGLMARTRSAGVALALAMALPAPGARAAEPVPASGFTFALRTGYAVPFGDAFQDTSGTGLSLSNLVSGSIPIWIDAGYRVDPNFHVGAFFDYGVAFAQVCPPAQNCSSSDIRLGAQVAYHVLPGAPIDPWIAIGFGYEWLSISGFGLLRGWEFFDIQVGADFLVGRAYAVGPFVAVSVAQFDTLSQKAAGAPTPADLGSGQSLHGWVQFGLKGTFNP